MTDFTFPLFNQKPSFHTAATPLPRGYAGAATRRRVARFLAAECANDVVDEACIDTFADREPSRRALHGD